MTIDKLRQVIATEPFRPFTICMADGRQYRVASREFVTIAPKAERTFVVAYGEEEYAILDLLLVTAFEFGNGHEKTKRRKAS